MSYWRFAAMIATSTAVMLMLMYINTYALEHLFFSETRTYMALLMGAAMAVVMLAFMLSMYASRAINAAIFVGSVAVFGAMLWLVRSQATVGDQSWMRAMIPHHSIAILTSERADLADPRVARLAEEIVDAQRREIAEMRYLIADIAANGPRAEDGPGEAEGPVPVGTIEEALSEPRLAGLDLAGMSAAEIAAALGAAPGCIFARSRAGDPVMAFGTRSAVVRLSGRMIILSDGTPTRPDGQVTSAVYGAPGIEVTVKPVDGSWPTGAGGGPRRADADLVFRLDRGLTRGYRGHIDCRG